VWDRCKLQQPHWEVEGQLVEAFMKWSSVLTHLFTLCAVFSKMAINPSSEVEKMCHLWGWNLDFKMLPGMYGLTHVSSRNGTDLDVKLMLLQRNPESCVRNPSQLGQQSWCPCNLVRPPCNPAEKPLV
jgi:hypothetical protein